MEKIYRVQMNSKGMPNFSTAVEIPQEWIPCSERLPEHSYTKRFWLTVKLDNDKDTVTTLIGT